MAFVMPKAIIKEKMAVLEEIPNSCSANAGKTVRSRPIIPPTKALMTTKSENCFQFSFNPNFIFSMVKDFDRLTKLYIHQKVSMHQSRFREVV